MALEIIDLIAPLLGGRFQSDFHLLVVGDHFFGVDLDIIKVDAGAGECLLGGDHIIGKGRHDLALSEPVKVAQFRGVNRLQPLVAPAVIGQFGQGGVAAGGLGLQLHAIAMVQVDVDAL